MERLCMERAGGRSATGSDACLACLPDELLENVLKYLCVYNDYSNARLVCKRWSVVVAGLVRRAKRRLSRALASGNIRWCLLTDNTGGHGTRWITHRYAQCACYLDKALYVFGGCTPTATTYNDVWMFDLTEHIWKRMVVSGSSPPPKAHASMVAWNDQMVVFGGWSPPNAIPLYQAPLFFNHLHIYSPSSNTWSLIATESSPPPTAGHCACVFSKYGKMVVFGGSRKHGENTNDLWVLDLQSMSWEQAALHDGSSLPSPRYGASLNALDCEHALMIGGSTGGAEPLQDVWLLSIVAEGRLWQWQKLAIKHPERSPSVLWCLPTCMVGDKIAVLGRSKQTVETLPAAAVDDRSARQPAAGYNVAVAAQLTSHRSTDTAAGGGHSAAASSDRAAAGVRTHSSSQLPSTSNSRNESSTSPSDGSGPAGLPTAPATAEAAALPPPALAAPDSRPIRGASPAAPGDDGAATFRAPATEVRRGVGAATSAAPAAGRGCGRLANQGGRAQRDRQRQLEALSRFEERLGARRRELNNQAQAPNGAHGQQQPPLPPQDGGRAGCSAVVRGAMQLQLLDTSTALVGGYVTWLEPAGAGARSADGIGERTFCSLAEARGELVLFGGVRPIAEPVRNRLPVSPGAITNSVVLIRPSSGE